MNITVSRYDPRQQEAWDTFVSRSKNGLFLFYRDYMDYHADRFTDHSLMFHQDGKLMAVMPANERDEVLYSHGGLTFGGILSGRRMRAPMMVEIFKTAMDYLAGRGFTRIEYKPVPHIYHEFPAEEELFALSLFQAQLLRRDVSSTIDMHRRIGLSKGRKWAIARSRKNGLTVSRSDDYQTFMAIESELLESKYGVKPVHSAAEMELLAGRFPEAIKLFAAYQEQTMIGGVVIYESRQVAHAQYIAANPEGKELGAVDRVLDYLLTDYYADKRYFDFGISNERDGSLNIGLNAFKEGFGARTVVYDRYAMTIG